MSRRPSLLELLPAYLDWCYAHGLVVTTAGFAQWLRVNRVTLYRWCIAEFGLPPSSLVRKDRITRAEELLTQPGVTTTEAASRAGYHSTGTMFREFRRHRGTTPRSIEP